MMLAITIIMIVGAVFIAFFSLPYLIVVLRTKNTVGVNLWMQIIFFMACLCFGIYGLGMIVDHNLQSGLPVAISNGCCLIMSGITLAIKFVNMSKAKKVHMTELEYWKSTHKGVK